MQLVIDVMGIGGNREGKLLRRFLPLLGVLQFHAAVEVVLALLAAEGAHGQGQQADDHDERNQRMPTVL